MTEYRVIKFKGWHVELLQEAGLSEPGRPKLDVPTLGYMERENSWTILANDRPILCGGTIKLWEGRYCAWSYLSADSGPHMRKVTRETIRHLNEVEGRVEMSVRCDFPLGHKWAKMLGFEVETPLMKKYGPSGEDHVGYVRFR